MSQVGGRVPAPAFRISQAGLTRRPFSRPYPARSAPLQEPVLDRSVRLSITRRHPMQFPSVAAVVPSYENQSPHPRRHRRTRPKSLGSRGKSHRPRHRDLALRRAATFHPARGEDRRRRPALPGADRRKTHLRNRRRKRRRVPPPVLHLGRRRRARRPANPPSPAAPRLPTKPPRNSPPPHKSAAPAPRKAPRPPPPIPRPPHRPRPPPPHRPHSPTKPPAHRSSVSKRLPNLRA